MNPQGKNWSFLLLIRSKFSSIRTISRRPAPWEPTVSVFDEVGGLRNSTPQTFYGDDTNLLLKVGTYGPCVVIDQPYTSAYRQHGKNSSKDVKAIADAILQLASTERSGGFGGGKARRWDRYRYIGGR